MSNLLCLRAVQADWPMGGSHLVSISFLHVLAARIAQAS